MFFVKSEDAHKEKTGENIIGRVLEVWVSTVIFYMERLILHTFLQENISSGNYTEGNMRINVTGIYKERYGMNNSAQNGMERQILCDFYR